MATETVTIVRIYLREGEHQLASLIKLLHDEERVSGVTVIRGIEGFGSDGKLHLATLLDLSLDLPLIVEFYDLPEKVEAILLRIEQHMGLSHIVTWQAQSRLPPQ